MTVHADFCRESITSAAVLCLHVEAGWRIRLSPLSVSTDYSTTTTTSVSPRWDPLSVLVTCHTAMIMMYITEPSPYSSSLQVSKLPKELRSVHQLCFSSDSSKLFASSSHSSVIVVALNQLECKYLHTLRPKSGESRDRLLSNPNVNISGVEKKRTIPQLSVFLNV